MKRGSAGRVRGLFYSAVLMLDLAGGIAFGWHFALGGAAGCMTAFAWLWVNARGGGLKRGG